MRPTATLSAEPRPKRQGKRFHPAGGREAAKPFSGAAEKVLLWSSVRGESSGSEPCRRHKGTVSTLEEIHVARPALPEPGRSTKLQFLKHTYSKVDLEAARGLTDFHEKSHLRARAVTPHPPFQSVDTEARESY